LRDTIALVVPSSHRWAYRKVIEAGQLLEEPLILREETSQTRRVVLFELAKHDINLDDLNIYKDMCYDR
jgi:DNA-binding transcriptional LysR family regulator